MKTKETKEKGLPYEDFMKKIEEKAKWIKNHPFLSAPESISDFFRYTIPVSLNDAKHEIKWAWQRVFKGYDDPSVWSHHSVMAKTTTKILRELAENKVGCPMDLYDSKKKKDECHKWKNILIEMAEGFEAATAIDNMDYFTEGVSGKYDKKESDKKRKILEKKFDKGMKLYHDHYFSLWD